MNCHYQLVVIGGGSGGMAAAKEAAKHGMKVALFDCVKPSPRGTKWGLGGTCVNVGCVPKKLMHYAGLLGASYNDARDYGWLLPEDIALDWSQLITTVKQLNFGYRVGLRSGAVTYINALAVFQSEKKIVYEAEGAKRTVAFEKAIVAVGGRPVIPDNVPGAIEHAITSDDLFSLPTAPGKTLIVGGSYIALECAGFLNALGMPVTVAVRSIVLRGFDRQCAEKVASAMCELGITFIYNNLPVAISKRGERQFLVENANGSIDEYETILYATGRKADTHLLGLEHINVTVDANGKIKVDKWDRTEAENVFAIGDVVVGRPELTPVAIKAGEHLARRLTKQSNAFMDYNFIPTTVFTPYEYACVGYSQEAAEEKFGKENVEVYLSEFNTLELSAVHRGKHPNAQETSFDTEASPPCLSKLICNKNDRERIVGLHFVGPNAGEVCQGYALAIRLGATKADFDSLVGIHPTDTESFCALTVTASSGLPFRASGGCGGGKCG